jgi:hypothetical protein
MSVNYVRNGFIKSAPLPITDLSGIFPYSDQRDLSPSKFFVKIVERTGTHKCIQVHQGTYWFYPGERNVLNNELKRYIDSIVHSTYICNYDLTMPMLKIIYCMAKLTFMYCIFLVMKGNPQELHVTLKYN